VGAGTLLLDAYGIQVVARRLTVIGFRRTARYIPPAAIRHVFREGPAVRIDVQTDSDRWFFRFWLPSAAQAAELVELLPTSRTIELDGLQGAASASAPEYRGSSVWLVVGAVLLGTLLWAGFATMRTNPARSNSGAVRGPAVPRPASVWSPVPSSKPARLHVTAADLLAARADLDNFSARFAALRTQFGVAFDALQRGDMSQEDFADGLERWLLPQWGVLEEQLTRAPGAVDGEAQSEVDAQLSAAAESWRRALSGYAHGLRNHDSSEVLGAFKDMAAAREHETTADNRLMQLEEHGGGRNEVVGAQQEPPFP
jgi:hypothetical protein